VYCVTVAFTMTDRVDQLHNDKALVHSTTLVQAFLAKHQITQVCQPPYSLDLPACDFWFFPKLKSPLKRRRFVNGRSHSTQAQSMASHCRLISPMEECLRIHSKVSSDWLPSYIKATRPVPEIFKTTGYVPDSSRT
jgi:hypothetical protein